MNEIYFSSTLNFFNVCNEENSNGRELKKEGVLWYVDFLYNVNLSNFICDSGVPCIINIAYNFVPIAIFEYIDTAHIFIEFVSFNNILFDTLIDNGCI